MGAKFFIKKAKNNQYYFVLTASNGEVIATSETYTRKGKAYAGITSVIQNSIVAEIDDQTYQEEG